jgi:hypothetical protein
VKHRGSSGGDLGHDSGAPWDQVDIAVREQIADVSPDREKLRGMMGNTGASCLDRSAAD